MKKIVGAAALVAAFGAIAVAPAGAGQSNVVAGAVYKGTYVSSGMDYNVRTKVYESGKGGNFTLKCAGIKRMKIDISKGKFQIRFGADEVMVKGRGRFKRNDKFKGEITKVTTPGSTCGTGEWTGAAVDTD